MKKTGGDSPLAGLGRPERGERNQYKIFKSIMNLQTGGTREESGDKKESARTRSPARGAGLFYQS